MKSVEVRLERLTKHYSGQVVAVDDVSLTVKAGEILALLGPSGCGKTTCLRMIAGLVDPTSGEIVVGGKPTTRTPVHRRNVGMLFQNYALFPHMTVAENVAFGLEMRGISKADREGRVKQALDLVQLHTFGDRLPVQLSGGQQQRVALARALVIEPSMLLLDEPLGALDKGLRESMQVEIRSLQQRLGLTTIMVTHDQDEALTMADQIAVMRDGNLEQIAPASEIYQKPLTRFVAGFIGASNFFEASVAERNGRSARLVTGSGVRLDVEDMGAVQGDKVVVTVRPEAISVSPLAVDTGENASNSTTARVEQVVYRGFMLHYYLRLDNGEPMIAYRQTQTEGFTNAVSAAGDRVRLSWTSDSNHVIQLN
ncbi:MULTISPECIES: ABC transporter ATP-binding protein [Rhizobium/Agrobacterium group]|uniref:ABC transporter ATP-binding protein n=1 Tax=Rhizobium/Agrobacterium group TaxID=227290 RepID=UPI00107FA2B9|nr:MULTISPECIES: ABC transporter ATP-binding protein [Rhizobium/Agrobacterium group]MBB4402053.1 putative spermidine/putrescine transport system ATP-binding protein/spermidine/putrescine transport system ATP-binding protein [Agrobacterium radiobacter]MBB5587341.1 putative spermidine/putrescine transport system ATP-binding protein/spermidine/putrescine transport system ATP-binding protein [Agrobacterium radiobacter]TGE90065.1 polyamine ABC transporter ATP-binding protein [Rhizobium sp. SEMIA 4032